MLTKNLKITDLPSLVNLHYEVLPKEFLTSISKSFLLGFYQNLFSSSNSHFIGISFPSNPSNSPHSSSNLIAAIVCLEKEYKPKYIPYFLLLLKTVPIFLIKLDKFVQLVQSFFFKLKEPQETEIFFIGVSKNHQGKGVGKMLINALEEKLKDKHSHLFVDCKCKLPSNNFYQSIGFKLKKTFKLYNEDWNHYAKPI